ncbi:hypothetical protein BU61_1090 [Pontoporia blainvillei]|uniref:SPIN-DOC-like zinc-finger domain-containing protein n=1 Tax=Pontoporia blainvillei TaxID=48723 RepID=A0ABX0S192_PONBL|nr:hypothetical protein [Pontoporia blainvillei]
MVCGAEIRAPSADTARAHILEQHPHTLDLSPSEKNNILEAWSEGVALLQDFRAEQPSPPHSDSGQEVEVDPDSDPDPEMPAEIVVLLDSEDNPSLPRRSRPRGLRPLELPDPPSPGSPTETFAAPAEVRHFTDGSFPAGFVLQLFSHTQLRASDSKDSPKEGRVAEGGLLQPESPSPGQTLLAASQTQKMVFLFFSFLFFFFFWRCWIVVAAHGLSLVVASGGYSSLRCAGFSLRVHFLHFKLLVHLAHPCRTSVLAHPCRRSKDQQQEMQQVCKCEGKTYTCGE